MINERWPKFAAALAGFLSFSGKEALGSIDSDECHKAWSKGKKETFSFKFVSMKYLLSVTVLKQTENLYDCNTSNRNHTHVNGYFRVSPNGKICKCTNGTVGTIFTNGNQKTLNVFLLPMVPLVDHVVLFITFTFACMITILLIYEIHDIFLGSPY